MINMYRFTMHIMVRQKPWKPNGAKPERRWEEETFAKDHYGKSRYQRIRYFVENWKNQGGDQILKEINDELGSK